MAAQQTAECLFKFFDDDNNGGVSLPELREAMAGVGAKFSDAELEAFFAKYDSDNNGELDFQEFCALCMSLNGSDTEQAVAKLFASVDKDGNNPVSLSHEEIRKGIATYTGKDMNDAEVTALIKQLDVDGDGEVSYEEFSTNILAKLTVAIKSGQ